MTQYSTQGQGIKTGGCSNHGKFELYGGVFIINLDNLNTLINEFETCATVFKQPLQLRGGGGGLMIRVFKL